jgi:hypothetical protein
VSSPRRARRSGRLRRRLIVAAGLAVAFVAGIGLGEALNDQPDAGGSQTVVRTLRPLPITALPSKTVTVTVANR